MELANVIDRQVYRRELLLCEFRFGL